MGSCENLSQITVLSSGAFLGVSLPQSTVPSPPYGLETPHSCPPTPRLSQRHASAQSINPRFSLFSKLPSLRRVPGFTHPCTGFLPNVLTLLFCWAVSSPGLWDITVLSVRRPPGQMTVERRAWAVLVADSPQSAH